PHWLLASGDEASEVVVWDVPTKQLRARCRGSLFSVKALAFSPDGTVLASAGVGYVWLWDTATGRLLLAIPGPDQITGLSFTGDGRHLAGAGSKTFNAFDAVIWELEAGRGLRLLRGLGGPSSLLEFSPDGKHLAALGQGWQVAIWSTESGNLLHVLKVPA